MAIKKTHYYQPYVFKTEQKIVPYCGVIRGKELKITSDSWHVTCQSCLNYLERDSWAAMPMGDKPEDFERMMKQHADHARKTNRRDLGKRRD